MSFEQSSGQRPDFPRFAVELQTLGRPQLERSRELGLQSPLEQGGVEAGPAEQEYLQK